MNSRLNKLAADGWRPSFHAEFLDLYNQRTQKISVCIKARIDDSNSYVVTEYE